MPAESELQESFVRLEAKLEAMQRAATRDGTLPAIGREILHDTRNTIHEVFFGRAEGASMPGTPLNPTQYEISAAKREAMHPYGPGRGGGGDGNVHGPPGSHASVPGRADATAARGGEPPAQSNTQQVADARDSDGQSFSQDKPPGSTWAEWIEQQRKEGRDGDASEDENARAKGRSLPEEQKEREKQQEQERGRGR